MSEFKVQRPDSLPKHEPIDPTAEFAKKFARQGVVLNRAGTIDQEALRPTAFGDRARDVLKNK